MDSTIARPPATVLTGIDTLELGLDQEPMAGGRWSEMRRVGGPCVEDHFAFHWTADEMGRIVRALVARKARKA